MQGEGTIALATEGCDGIGRMGSWDRGKIGSSDNVGCSCFYGGESHFNDLMAFA